MFRNTWLASSREKLKWQMKQTWRRYPYLHNKTTQVSSQAVTLAGAEHLPPLLPKQADTPWWEQASHDALDLLGGSRLPQAVAAQAASQCRPRSSSTWKYSSTFFSWRVQSQLDCQRCGEGPCGGVHVSIHGVSIRRGWLSTCTSLQDGTRNAQPLFFFLSSCIFTYT